MSKTHCRFCNKTYDGIYLRCPKCDLWLPPYPPKPMAAGGSISDAAAYEATQRRIEDDRDSPDNYGRSV